MKKLFENESNSLLQKKHVIFALLKSIHLELRPFSRRKNALVK